MTSTVSLLQEDCVVLLERALLNRRVSAFGEDGLGQHGASDTPRFFRVEAVFVELEADHDDDPSLLAGSAQLFLEGYDAADVGHICTDANFMISVNAHLAAAGVEPCLAYSAVEDQGVHYVQLDIDVGKLLGL